MHPSLHARPVALFAVLTVGGGLFVVSADAATANVALSAISRDGKSGPISGSAINLSSGKIYALDTGSPAPLPTGKYAVGAYINEYPALIVAARTVSISKSTTLTFDSRKAAKVSFNVGDPSVHPVALAVVPFASIGGKDRAFVTASSVSWPAATTYVLPDPAPGLRLGIHGVLASSTEPAPVRYDLAYSLPGMPSKVAFTTSKAKLARVDLNVGTIDEEQSSRLALTAKLKNLRPVTGVAVDIPVLGKQTSYRTPGLQWGSTLTMNDLDASAFLEEKQKAKKLLYAAGKTYREDWGLGIWGPRPTTPAFYTQNGKLTVAGGPGICAFSGTGVTLTACQLQPQTFMYTLARGKTPLGKGTGISVAGATTPQWYTATMTGSRNGTGDRASQVSAKWYFQAGGRYRKETATHIFTGENPVLPGYFRIVAAGADERNRVAAGSKTTLGLSVLKFGKVASMTLKYSTDGGKTWKVAKVTHKGAAWTAAVPAPASGLVSLKATAKNAIGGTSELTVLDAYGVR